MSSLTALLRQAVSPGNTSCFCTLIPFVAPCPGRDPASTCCLPHPSLLHSKSRKCQRRLRRQPEADPPQNQIPEPQNPSVPLQLHFPFTSIHHFKKVLINSGYTGTILITCMVQTNTCLEKTYLNFHYVNNVIFTTC